MSSYHYYKHINPISRFLFIKLILAALLTACSNSGDLSEEDVQAKSAFVVIGEEGVRVARALTEEDQCPLIKINREPALRMEMRAAAGTIPQRPMNSEHPKPAEFPVSTCEKILPPDTHSASINGRPLPLGKTDAQRIVVIGDTGCRVSQFSKAYQACNDPAQYPFAKIAELAANWKPDLVIHVGDYYYREDPCPADEQGCKDTPWGGGYTTWVQELFKPGKKLFAEAPWVMVRGNHETCQNGGQGWWRFLDPRPLVTGRDCNDPANDNMGNFSDPYAIPIDHETQLIVADTSNSGKKAIQPGNIRFEKYQDLYRKLTDLAQQAKYNIALFHQPILGFAANERKPDAPFGGNVGIQSVFSTLNPQLFPSSVNMLLSGDYHSWEQVSFSTEHPTQFVVGFSGTQLDAPLPKNISMLAAAGATPAPGAKIEDISVWPWGDRFGYMTMEKVGAAQWNTKVWDQKGRQIKVCHVTGRKSKCQTVWNE